MNYGPYGLYKIAKAELRMSHKNSQLPHVWQSQIFGYCFSILDKDTALIYYNVLETSCEKNMFSRGRLWTREKTVSYSDLSGTL
jgi:hypothetical protein